ncbi:MAG: signal recognition particle [Candidatus Bathyarchaeota archaeon B23]|nr:MAG: signal recognition particle [Candidatus Bathyarchaeota archaeon B23]
MVLEKLGSSLYEAVKRVLRAPTVDREVVKGLIRDFQRALLQADVDVKLVFDLSRRIEERAFEELPPGISRREHLVRVIYEELTRLVGERPQPLDLKPGVQNIYMLIGIQGSGKTTTAAKLARYLQRRGFKTALICADTFRPGAYDQLRQLAESIKVDFYGDPEGRDPLEIARRGVERFGGHEAVIIDTSGRHKEEKPLLEEMRRIAEALRPREVILVIDATIGQQAASQASAFKEATDIGSIIVAKLDGSARGGGALSSVAATGAPIKFIGTGEKVDDLEPFDPPRFIGRLLGMGDVEGLVRRVREAEVSVSEREARAILSGKLTLDDLYCQLEAVKKLGPLRRVLSMIPGVGYELPGEVFDVAEERLDRWRYILQSMTPEERENPRILNASRIRRIARGSGTEERDVRELIKQYNTMRKMLKQLRGRRRLLKQLQRFKLG